MQQTLDKVEAQVNSAEIGAHSMTSKNSGLGVYIERYPKLNHRLGT